jgi:DeoR family glycerol-3-phosphate regulon repressor
MALSRRQQRLLKWIRQDGFATVEALAEKFEVTPQTIRRDINALCEQNLLVRYHGGAGLPQSSVENMAYCARQTFHLEAKQAIAGLVAQRIPQHASLFINIGTTNEEVARALVRHQGLRVITNNLNVAHILCDNPDCDVIIAGGQVRHRDRGVMGESTIDFIRQFKVDFAIIGISGIEEDGTLRDFDYREVRVSQAIMQQSRKVLLVADHTKFGRNALVQLGHVSQIDELFTDCQPPGQLSRILAETATTVHIVHNEPTPAVAF